MINNVNVDDEWVKIQDTTSLTPKQSIAKIPKKEMTATLTPARMVELLKEIADKNSKTTKSKKKKS